LGTGLTDRKGIKKKLPAARGRVGEKKKRVALILVLTMERKKKGEVRGPSKREGTSTVHVEANRKKKGSAG